MAIIIMSVKIAWAKHLYNAYHSVKAGDSVYDSSGNLLGKADGCYARPTYKSPGSVCLISKGKFIWVSGNVEKRENDWKIQENTSVKR
tara:strand:- start:1315 stop:1578 length:264 start_codon:yes stop_codon:yes gene_type:complete